MKPLFVVERVSECVKEKQNRKQMKKKKSEYVNGILGLSLS